MNNREKRFVEHIKLRAIGDEFINKDEEKEILSFAISENIEVGKARVALKNYCVQKGIVLESHVEDEGRRVLIQSMQDEQIDKKEFESAVQKMLEVGKGRINDAECRRRMKKVVLENNWKVRDGLFRGGDWFDDIKV
jgi:hypothetical protein